MEELAVLFRTAGARFVEIEAADTASEHGLQLALGLPLVAPSRAYRWQGGLGPSMQEEGADPLAHPLAATEPVIRDMVRTLVDSTMSQASAVMESSKDFGFTPELAAKVQQQGLQLGGAFRRHASSRLVVRVARDRGGFDYDG